MEEDGRKAKIVWTVLNCEWWGSTTTRKRRRNSTSGGGGGGGGGEATTPENGDNKKAVDEGSKTEGQKEQAVATEEKGMKWKDIAY